MHWPGSSEEGVYTPKHIRFIDVMQDPHWWGLLFLIACEYILLSIKGVSKVPSLGQCPFFSFLPLHRSLSTLLRLQQGARRGPWHPEEVLQFLHVRAQAITFLLFCKFATNRSCLQLLPKSAYEKYRRIIWARSECLIQWSVYNKRCLVS